MHLKVCIYNPATLAIENANSLSSCDSDFLAAVPSPNFEPVSPCVTHNLVGQFKLWFFRCFTPRKGDA